MGFVINFLLVSLIMYEGARYHLTLMPLFGQVMVFLSYMLLVPTPGASGFAEIGAPLIFGQEIPRHEIISMVSAMRLSGLGVQILVGMSFMFLVLKQTFSFEEIKRFRKSKN